MAKAKESKGKRCRFKVQMSFELERKQLPKAKAGILVKDEEFTLCKGEWFKPGQLDRLLQKGYLRELKPKKLKKKGAKI